MSLNVKNRRSIYKRSKQYARNWLNQRFSRWLAKRMPSAHQQQINRRNIFIMPSRFGAALMCLTFVLFLLGTNYQNNIIILVSYLLVSFFIVALLHSFFNLSGLIFKAPQTISGFVGQQLRYPLIITTKSTRFSLYFSFSDSDDIDAISKKTNNESNTQAQDVFILDELSVGDNEIQIPYKPSVRGQYRLARVLIKSEYAFGLFRTWTRLDFGHVITAYPAPVSYAWQESQTSVVEDNQQEQLEERDEVKSYQDSFELGTDEFHQLQQYKDGEPLSRVAWKQVARGQGWLTKQYQQLDSGKLLLDFDAMPASTVEQRLSLLSFAINECQLNQIAFSLKLPNQQFGFDNTHEHVVSCLTALACYQDGRG